MKQLQTQGSELLYFCTETKAEFKSILPNFNSFERQILKGSIELFMHLFI